jgi:hypothetical protein
MLSLVRETPNGDDEGTTILESVEEVDNFKVNFPTSLSPPSPPPKRTGLPHLISPYDPKTQSIYVHKFLNAQEETSFIFR